MSDLTCPRCKSPVKINADRMEFEPDTTEVERLKGLLVDMCCPVCKKLVLGQRPRYCSHRCKISAKNRRYRERVKEREMEALG